MAKAIPVGRAALIRRLRAAAAKLGKSRLTRAEFIRETGITQAAIVRCFGGYDALVAAAGMPGRYHAGRLGDDALLQALRDAFAAEGPLISLRRVVRLSGRCESTFRNHWGCWRHIVAAFLAWAEREDPDFPHLETLRLHHRLPPRNALSGTVPERRLGELLRFRTLEYAPTSEGGVIYLFGMIAGDLGFLVDGISKSFPDAEAKRRVGDEWRRVRIEFEHRSRNFRAHHHDPAACDLIICWEHNWPDCPVEVLELKSALKELPNYVDFPGVRSSTQPLIFQPGPSRAIS